MKAKDIIKGETYVVSSESDYHNNKWARVRNVQVLEVPVPYYKTSWRYGYAHLTDKVDNDGPRKAVLGQEYDKEGNKVGLPKRYLLQHVHEPWADYTERTNALERAKLAAEEENARWQERADAINQRLEAITLPSYAISEHGVQVGKIYGGQYYKYGIATGRSSRDTILAMLERLLDEAGY